MKAYFHKDRLLTIDGTPQEVALFMDIRAMGPKVPEEKPKLPFIPFKHGGYSPITTTGQTPPITWVDNGYTYIKYAEKPE